MRGVAVTIGFTVSIVLTAWLGQSVAEWTGSTLVGLLIAAPVAGILAHLLVEHS